MPATDVEQQLREAIGAILAANATIATLCGGTAQVVDRGTTGPAPTVPCVVYEISGYDEATGRTELLLTGVADEADAGGKARELAKAAVDALTQSAFAAHSYGLQVAPSGAAGRSVDDAGQIEIEGAPNLRQADRALTLLVLE